MDCQDIGSFTHITKLLSYVTHGGPGILFVSSSYYFPHHCMSYDSSLEQGCYLIFSIGNKHTQEREEKGKKKSKFIFSIKINNLVTFSISNKHTQER